ncbi:unnamed protein product [Ceutorhynchus assimilis]|uniref:Uncharacterized protein n=1 Tax=Ceutorhynchus assimilis TaxID=467358 RepID=A0A9N9MNH0_9CUCU|nr:unnamed protein product [Ceutorhynchus assimilis]
MQFTKMNVEEDIINIDDGDVDEDDVNIDLRESENLTDGCIGNGGGSTGASASSTSGSTRTGMAKLQPNLTEEVAHPHVLKKKGNILQQRVGKYHNQSYNSLDCSFKLDTKIYTDSKVAVKLSCGRTKSQAIVQNVLPPMVLEKPIELLRHHFPKLFFSVQLDASNRKNVKLFPISVQMFTVEGGLQNFMLHFCENSDESADWMFNMVNNSLKELKLDWGQVSSLSADNTNSNYGAHHSLFTNILAKNENILKRNCHAHLIHNCVKFSMDTLSLDVENLVLKIYSHFFVCQTSGRT